VWKCVNPGLGGPDVRILRLARFALEFDCQLINNHRGPLDCD
jgi:hypothetical protein